MFTSLMCRVASCRARWFVLLALPLMAGAGTVAWADRVILTNGQTIEGVVTNQNQFEVSIETRGVVVPVPRQRVESIEIKTTEENARMLLDAATQAAGSNQVAAARALVEQARLLGVKQADLDSKLQALDNQVSEMEAHGGTPEERRRRAQASFDRAANAYDAIQTEQGDGLLIEALKCDPTMTKATEMMNDRLGKQAVADSLLAVRYFVEVLYPDHLPPSSPVYSMLPAMYQDVAKRLDATNDAQMVSKYDKWLKTLNAAIQAHPAWATNATDTQQALLAKPLKTLLTEVVVDTLKRGDMQVALLKLQTWANPKGSASEAILCARAYIGAGQDEQAVQTIDEAEKLFPNDLSLRLHAKALALIAQGIQALRSGAKEQGVQALEQVFNSNASLPTEYMDVIGRQLAGAVAADLVNASADDVSWQTADRAALVMHYAVDSKLRKGAAQILSKAVYATAWDINFAIKINGVEMPISQERKQAAVNALAAPLGIRDDPTSPFHFTLTMNMYMSDADADRLASVLGKSTLGVVNPPARVTGLQFVVSAEQVSLGDMLDQASAVQVIPSAVRQRRAKLAGIELPKETTGRAAGAPASRSRSSRGKKGRVTTAAQAFQQQMAQAQGAGAPATGAAAASNATSAGTKTNAKTTSSTTTLASATLAPILQPAFGDALLLIASPLDIDAFLKNDLGDFVSAANMSMITSRLKVPYMRDLLTEQEILK